MVSEMSFPTVFCDMDNLIRMQELTQEYEDDETSSFIFHAPRSINQEDGEQETLPRIVTPAQEIVNRYRAGIRCNTEEISSSPSSPSSSLRSSTSSETTACTEDDEEEPRTPESNCGLTVPKIRFRQSRFDALNEMRVEAVKEMKKSGVSEDHPLVCPRPDCRDTLSNLHALTLHLHLHDIDCKKSYECDKCSATFKTRRRRRAHSCGTVGSKSAPTSPLYATFGTILSKITSLN
ncbi:hypothetical protein E1B28_010983 [Marasmius oreades]|uniref:C2H2-type domain-containing protein n=1 Tax=Marasmius oreades TaxID=181124 RepID=A0A9P7UPQ8_9AGAR|nr:uncharacterized protein E1B28_010983 [Marasmius oreades]KAG7089285.1 hypothetical protein E1B28_010983 [Marasmius oreades]